MSVSKLKLLTPKMRIESVIFLVLLYTFGAISWPHREWAGEFSEPRICAFNPRGIRVTTHTIRGLSSVQFSGTIFRESKNVPIHGSFVLDPTRPRRRKWVFENTDAILKVGDILNYEIYVEGKGGTRYKSYDGNSEIHELVNRQEWSMQRCPHSRLPIPSQQPEQGVLTAPTTEKSVTPEPVDTHLLEQKLKNCQEGIRNTTNLLLEIQSNVLTLESKNRLLANLVSKSPEARQLTLSGVIPQEGSPVETVSFIIWEKLDIKAHVVSARRHNATTIVFEVETLDEKLDILEEAEDRLSSGRITIY